MNYLKFSKDQHIAWFIVTTVLLILFAYFQINTLFHYTYVAFKDPGYTVT